MTGTRDDLSTALQVRFDPSPPADSSFVLVVIEGPATGQTFVLDGSNSFRVLVGQGPACELRLEDPQVSRRHAALSIVGSRLRIVDLGSKNGTLVQGIAIVEALLTGGEIVRMGKTAFRLERGGPANPPALAKATSFGRMVGGSTEMRRLYPLCERLAGSDVPVVIEGETGTGKEVLAESLHEVGPRATGPFVVFDCTSVPASLLESELFGHERGSFTGATSTRKGVFELANHGTLLIDEIGDLDLALQPKLLRAVERSEIRRVGGDRPIRVNVRLLAATRRDLDHEVQAGRFRDDLFHRLAVTRIELPPLRERRGDVSVLARFFWKTLGGREEALSHDLLLRWEDSPWHGNIRELRNAIARQLALGDLVLPQASAPDPLAEPGDFRNALGVTLALKLPLADARSRVVQAFERLYIEHMLAEHGGNATRAAAAAGVARRYFNLMRARLAK